MLPIRPTSQFKRDLKRVKRQKRDVEGIKRVLVQLSKGKPLPTQYKDHKLKGTWRDFRECRIETDLLLIYTITDFELRPVRLGTYSELFEWPFFEYS